MPRPSPALDLASVPRAPFLTNPPGPIHPSLVPASTGWETRRRATGSVSGPPAKKVRTPGGEARNSSEDSSGPTAASRRKNRDQKNEPPAVRSDKTRTKETKVKAAAVATKATRCASEAQEVGGIEGHSLPEEPDQRLELEIEEVFERRTPYLEQLVAGANNAGYFYTRDSWEREDDQVLGKQVPSYGSPHPVFRIPRELEEERLEGDVISVASGELSSTASDDDGTEAYEEVFDREFMAATEARSPEELQSLYATWSFEQMALQRTSHKAPLRTAPATGLDSEGEADDEPDTGGGPPALPARPNANPAFSALFSDPHLSERALAKLALKLSDVGICSSEDDEPEPVQPSKRRGSSGQSDVGPLPNAWMMATTGLELSEGQLIWEEVIQPLAALKYNTEVTAARVQEAFQNESAVQEYKNLLRTVVGLPELQPGDVGGEMEDEPAEPDATGTNPKRDSGYVDEDVVQHHDITSPGGPPGFDPVRMEPVFNYSLTGPHSSAEMDKKAERMLHLEQARCRDVEVLATGTAKRLSALGTERAPSPAFTDNDYASHQCDEPGCTATNQEHCNHLRKQYEEWTEENDFKNACRRAAEAQRFANLRATGHASFANAAEKERWERRVHPSVTMQYGSGQGFDVRQPVSRRNEEDWTDARRARLGLGPWAGAKDTRMHPPFQSIEDFQAEHPCAPPPGPAISSTPARRSEAEAFSIRSGRSPGRASPALTIAKNPSLLGPRMAQTLLRKRRDSLRGNGGDLHETIKAAVTEAVAPLQAMFIRNNLRGSDEISAAVAQALAVWLGPCVNTDTVESYQTCCDKRWPEFQATQPEDYGRYLEKLRTPMAKAAQIVLYAMWRYESAGRRAEQIDSDITALKWMFAHNPPFEVDFFKLDILAKARSRYMRNEEEVILYTMKTASKEASILPSEFLPTLQSTHYRNTRVNTSSTKDELTKFASCLALHLASNTGARLGHYAVSKKSQRNLIKAGQMLFWVGDPTQPEDEYEWVSGASTGLATYFCELGSSGPTYPTRWVHVVHYQINTSKTVGSKKGQKAKTTKKQVRAVSITRASALASTTLDMLVKWCIAMPLAKDDPLLTVYRTDLSGKRQDTKTVFVQRPGSSAHVEHMRRYLQYADVTAAIKMTVINGACGSLNPAHFTTRSVRRTFMELSGTLMTRTEACLLGQWSEDSLVPENVYKQDGVLVGALDRLTEENIAALDCSAERVKADLDERDRQYAFLRPGFEAPGHAPIRGAPAGSKGLVLGQKFPDRPEEIASGEAESTGRRTTLMCCPPNIPRSLGSCPSPQPRAVLPSPGNSDPARASPDRLTQKIPSPRNGSRCRPPVIPLGAQRASLRAAESSSERATSRLTDRPLSSN